MASLSKKLLIVEDSPLILERMLRLLQGMERLMLLGTASTAEEALRRIRTDRPDLLLLDIALAEGDGFQVLEGMRSVIPGPEVIMFTNFANPLFRQRAASYGVRNFFDKSTEFDRAVHCLRTLVIGEGKRDPWN